jgi:hypothetical protein
MSVLITLKNFGQFYILGVMEELDDVFNNCALPDAGPSEARNM